MTTQPPLKKTSKLPLKKTPPPSPSLSPLVFGEELATGMYVSSPGRVSCVLDGVQVSRDVLFEALEERGWAESRDALLAYEKAMGECGYEYA
jgi:hypothetical protein